MEQGEYQRWLEQRAYDAIARRTYQDQTEQDRDRNNLNKDIAVGCYEWGSEACVNALRTQLGSAKLLAVILKDQGMTEAIARRWVERQLAEIAAVLMSKVQTDPLALAVALSRLGLPSDFLSSASATPHSSTDSTTSEPSPTIS